MTFRILKSFKGDRKYFTIVFFILILILISALITPVIISSVENDWKNQLNMRTKETEGKIISEFNKLENNLLDKTIELKTDLRYNVIPDPSFGGIIEVLNKTGYEKFSVEVYAPNGRLIGWNKNSPVGRGLPFPLEASTGEVHFTDTGLMTWLSVLDTINFDSEHFYVILHFPFKKHYRLQNPYYKEIDFEKRLSEELFTPVSFNISGFREANVDGRYHSFNLLNAGGSRIAEVTFLKPLLDSSLNQIKEISSIIQSILLILGYLFLMQALRNDFREINSNILRFIILAVYLGGFRILLYLLNIPAVFFNGNIDNPAFFASPIAWGIVKSPIEFLVTNIFLLIIALNFYFYIRVYAYTSKLKSYWYYILVLPAAFLFLMAARGLNAAVKSIIFDSSLRYFKNPEIIPDLPGMMMNFNLLMIGFVVVVILVSILTFILSLRKQDFKDFFWITFALFQVSGFLFVYLQRQPLITPLMEIVFISLVFLAHWFISRKTESVYNFVYIAVAASVISVALLNYFNQHLEKESLKTTALELNRPNENLINFLIRETLRSASTEERVKAALLGREKNFTSLAFTLWANSPLQGESLNSSVSVLDRNKNLLGEFSITQTDNSAPSAYFEQYDSGEIRVVQIDKEDDRKLFKGIIAVVDGGKISGYITASVLLDSHNPSGIDFPDFLVSQKNIFNSVIDASQLKIFEIHDSKLTHVYGDIYPSRDQIKPVINAEYSSDNESWQLLELNKEKYIAYALKNTTDDQEKITVVLYQEKQITWNLFNFFKIFIIHALFILILFIIIFLANIRKFRYTFRMQLLTAFLLISIIPVILLAAFIRQTVNEKSSIAISNELNERLGFIENHVRSQMTKHKDRDYNDAFQNAAGELGISFNVYENTNQTFSSKAQYYNSGLFNSRLNPLAHYQLNYLSFREYLTSQEIENFSYNGFYKKLNIGEKDFILGVNDAFNKVQLSFTQADADILLFGVYSFAVIIIIIINTILANKISAPVRQLIRATSAVAQGDLSIQVENKEKGEMRDLINGFNAMTNELRKNEVELAQLERETAWKEMAKQVAHEIKNPLTPMKLAVQQMIISFKENKNFAAIFTRVSETLLNQIENLNEIASEFSRFARMPHYNLEKVDLTNIIKDTANLFVDEKTRIQTSIDTNESYAEADNSQLRRLLINMIRNSIQSGADEINIALKECGEGYEIFIRDNGSGIKPEIQEKIFDPDFTTKEKGMGLGLKLAKRFIEGIKGDISLVESSEKGTVFRIYIPGIKQG